MKSKNLFIAGALALSTVMTPAASMFNAMPVSAATIEIDQTGNQEVLKDHTFTAYQIFSGELSGENLINVEWANDAYGNAIQSQLSSNEGFSGCTTAEDFAKKLESNEELKYDFAKAAYAALSSVPEMKGVSSTNGTITVDGNGYYLIVDETEENGDKTIVVNPLVLRVVGDGTITVDPKTEVPQIEKKVREGQSFGDVADHEINQVFEFQFTSTVPANVADYTGTYTYVIHDKMDPALKLNNNGNFRYTITDQDGTAITEFETPVVTEKPEDGDSFDITFNGLNVAKFAGATITVTFEAVIDPTEFAKLDQNTGNRNAQTNTVSLEFSNDTNSNSTSETPEDKVIIFTYELDLTKVDAENKKITLSGAKFVLKNDQDQYARVNNGVLTGWGDLNGATTLESGADGTFMVVGLDDGVYTLVETEAPVGYQGKDSEFEITITAQKASEWAEAKDISEALTEFNATVDNGTSVSGDVNKASVALTITNGKGAKLPSTGGMGTTMLYIGGSAMVGIAAVFYVTNKRMRKDEE